MFADNYFSCYRRRFSNVAFIYVSDDMKWGKENLAHLGKNDLYFIGHGESETLVNRHNTNISKEMELTPKSSSLDFALLSLCNHTIGSRGTFSIWISRFAGGKVLTEFSPGYKEFKELYKPAIKMTPKRDISEL